MVKNEIQQILDDAFNLVGNPIAMIDTSYMLLAHTQNPVDDDPFWNELIECGTFSHETVDFFNRAQFILKVADSDRVALLQSDRLKYDRVCGKFFDANGIQLGSICVVACLKPFDDEDYRKISLICEWTERENNTNGVPVLTERVFRDDTWLCSFLEGERPEPEQLDFYKDLKKNLFIAVVDISQYEHTVSHLAYFRDLFAQLQPEYQYIIHGNNLVILLSGDDSIFSVSRDMVELQKFFEQYNIFAGVSGVFQNLLDMPKHYRQALVALNRGMTSPCGQKIFKYETFALDYILNMLEDIADLQELCNPIVLQILEYDQTNGTSYFEFLHTFLLNAENIPLTCHQMCISESVAHAKVKEMGRLFEINWTDGNLMSSLLISIKIKNMSKKRKC